MASILFTNVVLSGRTGTEVATIELAQAMRRRGHRVMIFSPTLGKTALEARALGIPVTSHVDRITVTPDVIHGNHNVPLALAMLRFPGVPAVFVCHDSANTFDEPLLAAGVGAYVAVDAACRDRLVVDGVDEARISVIPNGVDLDRFRPREAWQQQARTALLVVKQRTDHLAVVTEACRQAGLALEVVGPGVGRVVNDLAERCRHSDIVFAHSRSAIEAACVGAAVIVIDEFGFGGWFGREQVTGFPDTTLSRRLLGPLPDVDTLIDTLAGYDASEALAVTTMLRQHVDLAMLAGRWEALYDRLARPASGRPGPNAAASQGELSAFFARHLPDLDQTTELQRVRDRLRTQEQMLTQMLGLLRTVSNGQAASVAFHPGALGQMLLSEGWHPPEDWGVWSAAEHAVLWLPEWVFGPWNYVFQVECSRYIPAGDPADAVRRVDVYSGGRRLTQWWFTPERPEGPKDKRIEVPYCVRPPPGHAVRLEFRIDRPLAPAEAGESTDRRSLGLRLTGLVAFPA